MEETYKGRSVRSRALNRRDLSGWSADVFISEAEEEADVDSKFSLSGVFSSETKAHEAAIVVGKQEVDRRDIRSVIEESTRLPSTPRNAYGSHSDDLGMGKDGRRRGVPSSGNPDDRFN